MVAVAVLAVGAAIQISRDHAATSRAQWALLHHDRNAYLAESMRYAFDFRNLDPASFVADLHRSKIHPPLFQMLGGFLMALGGLRPSLPAAVSLAGWIGTVVLVFVVTRRLAPFHPNGAGFVAALLAVRSPPLRDYATDVMLESLGACLTLLVFQLSLRARESTRPRRDFALLGCGLTALFFLKYNYWVLAVLLLLLREIPSWTRLKEALRRMEPLGRLRSFLSSEARQPLSWILGAILASAGLLFAFGKREIFGGGERISSRASLDLLYGAFVVLSLRMALSAWRHRAEIHTRWDVRWRQLLLFHLLPVTVWLLWPMKLQNLLFFLGPSNASPAQRARHLGWESVAYYPRAVLAEFHDDRLAGLFVVGLALCAIAGVSRLGRDARSLLGWMAVSALLLALHPNQQSRYLLTWIPFLWIAAALGLALLAELLAGHGRLGRVISGALPAFVVLALAIPLGRTFLDRGRRATEERPPTALDLSEYYLPRIGNSPHVTVLSTVSLEGFFQWTYLERYPTQRANLRPAMTKLGGCSGVDPVEFSRWLDQTPTQTIVFVDVPPGSFFSWEGEEGCQQYRELLRSQTLFREVERRSFARYGCTVSIFLR